MSIFLEEIGNRRPDKTIIMFADKASWHTSSTLKIPENIRLLPLPSYSPHLNPTENIWHELREKWFYNRYFAALADVESRLMEALIGIESNSALVKSITAFNWIVSPFLIAE